MTKPLPRIAGEVAVSLYNRSLRHSGSGMIANAAAPGCSGSGLVSVLGCACDGNAHTCIPVTCPVCHGTGKYRNARCRACHVPHQVVRHSRREQRARSPAWDAPPTCKRQVS